MSFGCTKCGACCKIAKRILQGHPFPYKFNEDGSCEKYDPLIGCTVYDNRPDCCNIEKGYPVYNSIMPMSKQTYYDLSGINCNSWQSELGIDKSFNVKTSK